MSFHPFPVLQALALAAAALALPAQAQTADPNLARNLAATCANCHGTNGNARGDMKPIAGMPADKLIAMLDDYRAGNQPATIMHQIVKGYTPEQIKLIAGYFAAQKPKK
jgi:cytochrome subunit of sulfide dehydrogenase